MQASPNSTDVEPIQDLLEIINSLLVQLGRNQELMRQARELCEEHRKEVN